MIYVNGDSYCSISNGKRYSDFLGEMIGDKVVNASISGSCNNRIFRTSMRDLIELKKTEKNITAIISLTFPIRTEIWDLEHTAHRFRQSNDGDFFSLQPTNSKSWFYDKEDTDSGKYEKFSKQFLTWYNVEAITLNLLKEILMFSGWCEANNINTIIFSGPLQEPIDFNTPFIKPFIDELSSFHNIIDIFSFSFTQWCVGNGFVPIDNYSQEIHGKTYIVGHHGELAHKAFAQFLIQKYIK
jgi:hypothetical protein